QALTELLGNTDIGFQFTAADAVALFRKPPQKTAGSGRYVEFSPPPHTVTISTDREVETPYNSTTTLAAAKVDAPVLTVPISSESVTSALLRDQQVGRLEDAMQYVSAVELAPAGQSAAGFNIRGVSTYQYYLDGVRVSPNLHHDGFRDFANIERVD